MFAFLRKVFKSKKSGHYFIHIPKTAGTSFINILDNCHEFDLKLYNHALQKFEEKYAQMCKKLKSEFHTESSKDINQLIDNLDTFFG